MNSICNIPQLDTEGALLKKGNLSWRQNIQVVRLRLETFLYGLHVHRCMACQNLREVAALIRRKMRDDDIGHSGVFRKTFEEFPERLQTACGSPDSNHRVWKGCFLVLLIPLNRCVCLYKGSYRWRRDSFRVAPIGVLF